MTAQATLNKQANALISLYIQQYKLKYEGAEPIVNRYRERWGFLSMIEDLGYERARIVIERFFGSGVAHPVNKLLQNYDRIHKLLLEAEKDEKEREELRRETERRVREWEAKYGNEDTGSTERGSQE